MGGCGDGKEGGVCGRGGGEGLGGLPVLFFYPYLESTGFLPLVQIFIIFFTAIVEISQHTDMQ